MSDASLSTFSAALERQGLKVVHELGRGSEAAVYKVERADHHQFAAKLCHSSAEADPNAAVRFRREASILARLKHPGLVRVLLADETGDHRPYLVMELADGQPLSQLISGRAGTEAFVLQLGKDLAGALAEVHRLGLVHRDVKPQNILIQGSGSTKLLDFGFATLRRSDAKGAGDTVGTLAYAPPEQTGMVNRSVDGRADLYALGVVLFEAATGRLPFLAKDAGQLVRMHALEPPPPVRSLNPGISAGLEAIIATLLQKDPDDRYQTGEALLADLERLASLDTPERSARALAPSRGFAGLHGEDIPLAGRSRELALVEAAWHDVVQGNGTILVVEGEGGTGKTRLVRQLLSQVAARETLVLSAKSNKGTALPFAPLRTAIDGYLLHVESRPSSLREVLWQRLRSAGGEAAPLLKRLSPALSRVFHDVPDVRDLSALQEQFLEAIAGYLLAFASWGPYILFLDDVQWLDDSTRQVLIRLAEKLEGVPLLVLCTARNDPESRPAVERLLGTLDPKRTRRLSLGPLDEAAVGEVLTAHLGGQRLDPALVTQIATRTGGVPFTIGEYVRAMLDAGAIRPVWGSWTVSREIVDALDLPTDVLQLVVQRVDGLARTTQQMLTSASVVGATFPVDLLASVMGLHPNALADDLRDAKAANLLEPGKAGEYSFVHDRIRDALFERLTPDERAALHERCAEELDRRGGNDPDYLYALARHYALGRPGHAPQRVAETNRQAGITAMHNLAFDEAYGFLKTAREAGRGGDAGLEEALGEVCMNTHRLPEAIEHFETGLTLTQDAAQRVRLRTSLARTFTAASRTSRAWEEVQAAFLEAGFQPPRHGVLHFARALFALFWELLWGPPKASKLSAEERARKQTLLRLYQLAGYVAPLKMDESLLLQGCTLPMSTARALGPCAESATSYAVYAVALGVVLKNLRLAERFARMGVAMAEQENNPPLLANAAQTSVFAVHFAGYSRVSEERGRLALEKHGRWYDTYQYVFGTADLAWNLCMRGYRREGWEWTHRGHERCRLLPSQNPGMTRGHPLLAYEGAQLAGLGRREEALEYMRLAEASYAEEDPFGAGSILYGWVWFHYETGELGKPLDDAIRRYHEAKLPPPEKTGFHIRAFYLFQLYGRLEQCFLRRSRGEEVSVTELQKAVADLRRAANVPILKAHLRVGEAAVAYFGGKHERAFARLEKADALARALDAPWVACEAHRLRAHLWRDQGDRPASLREAWAAQTLASTHALVNLEQRITVEFKLGQRASSISGSVSESAGSVTSVRMRRRFEALLQVSLASADIGVPERQARATLDELVKVLNAERAFLFLANGESSLQLTAGRDSQGQDLTELKGYSSTVVERVRASRTPLVVTGTDEGAALGSESAVAHDLRSIIAAPLLMRNQLLGVVYLDSHLAKGIFTHDDAEVLTAIGNHIAISLETARMARLEVQRQALAKDLAVTAAVQSLLLPATDTWNGPSISLTGYYRPAAQSGGDWWWYEPTEQGLVALLGDVTGHGAGSAMVTAAVAGAFRALQPGTLASDLPAAIQTVNATLSSICKNAYNMTLSAALVDPTARTLKLWSAGALPALLLRADTGRTEVLQAQGGPLGNARFKLGLVEVPLRPGDRLLLFTDGITEALNPQDRPFGLKGLSKLLLSTRGRPPGEARTLLVDGLTAFAQGRPLEDDVAFVLFDAL